MTIGQKFSDNGLVFGCALAVFEEVGLADEAHHCEIVEIEEISLKGKEPIGLVEEAEEQVG